MNSTTEIKKPQIENPQIENIEDDDFGFDASFESKVGDAYPFAQLINPSSPIAKEDGSQILQPYGMAIRLDNAEKVGLFDLDKHGWQLVDYEFSAGGIEKLWMTQKPRFLVIRKTPVFVSDRSTKKIVGQFNKDTYNKLLHKTFTEVIILILGTNNELLHAVQEMDEFDFTSDEPLPMPLKVKLGGAGGSRFGAAYKSWDSDLKIGKGFISELELAYSKKRGLKTPKRMTSLWHAHGVFAPTITSKPAGQPPNTRNVCDFGKYEIPNPENLGNFLIKANTETSKYVIALHNKFEDYLPKVGTADAGSADADDIEEYGTATSAKGKKTPTVPASTYMAGASITSPVIEDDFAEEPPY